MTTQSLFTNVKATNTSSDSTYIPITSPPPITGDKLDTGHGASVPEVIDTLMGYIFEATTADNALASLAKCTLKER